MKKMYVTIIILPGMMLGGYLYGKQLHENMYRLGSGIQHAERIEQFVGKPADSLRTEPESGAEKVPGDIHDRLADVFENLEDFSFHFNDSAMFHEHFQEMFGPEFRQKMENLKAEFFSEQFFEKLQENLEKFHKEDFRIELDKDFREQLHEKLDEMRRRLEDLDQQMQEKYGRGRAI